MYFKSPDIGSRLASAVIDQIIGIVLKVFVWMPFLMALIRYSELRGPAQDPIQMLSSPKFIVSFIFISSFYYLKDVLNGRSPGKRILGLQVVDNKTGLPASPIKLVLRSLGLILLPVEFVMLFVSPERRLGDFIAGTRVVEYQKREAGDFPFMHHLFAVILSLIFSASSYLPWLFVNNIQNNNPIAAPEPYYRTEDIKEKPTETENLTDYFKTKYDSVCESILLSSQALEGQNASMISGSFILKKDLFVTQEVYDMKEKIRQDIKTKMSGKLYSVDISIVYLGGEDPKQLKLEFTSNE